MDNNCLLRKVVEENVRDQRAEEELCLNRQRKSKSERRTAMHNNLTNQANNLISLLGRIHTSSNSSNYMTVNYIIAQSTIYFYSICNRLEQGVLSMI